MSFVKTKSQAEIHTHQDSFIKYPRRVSARILVIFGVHLIYQHTKPDINIGTYILRSNTMNI